MRKKIKNIIFTLALLFSSSLMYGESNVHNIFCNWEEWEENTSFNGFERIEIGAKFEDMKIITPKSSSTSSVNGNEENEISEKEFIKNILKVILTFLLIILSIIGVITISFVIVTLFDFYLHSIKKS